MDDIIPLAEEAQQWVYTFLARGGCIEMQLIINIM